MPYYDPDTKRLVGKQIHDHYEGFYERAFDETNVENILRKGGGLDVTKFGRAIKGNTQDKGYEDALKNDKLKAIVFSRYFAEEGAIALNKRNQPYVAKGKTFVIGQKTYKAGKFLPFSVIQ